MFVCIRVSGVYALCVRVARGTAVASGALGRSRAGQCVKHHDEGAIGGETVSGVKRRAARDGAGAAELKNLPTGV